MKWLKLCGIVLASLMALSGCSEKEARRPLTILIPVGANTLDPDFATSTVEWSILMNLFEPLIIRNDDMTLGPGLAESWEVDDTKKIWTLHLRRGVKFHNGEPFNAQSVKFTFDRMADRKLKPRITIRRRLFLESVEIVDDYTVRLHTQRPVATLPVWLVNAFMLPPKYYASTSAKETLRKPVGTGPYRLARWLKDDRIEMTANAEWWRGKPKVEKVVWRPVPEVSARVAELETGGADIITNISPEQGRMLEEEGKGLTLQVIGGGRRVYIGIQEGRYPLGDKRVRQALNYAVDFEAIVKNILLGYGSRMASIVNKPNEDPTIQPYTYDPAKAKSLLAAAGLKDEDGDGVLDIGGEPFRLRLDVPTSRYLKGKEIAETVAADLRAVGVDVRVVPLEWSVFLNRRRKKRLAPLYYHGFSSAFNAELDLGVLRPNLFANLTAWNDPEFIEGYRMLGQTFEPAERKKISYRLQHIVHEEAPWIFLWKQYDFYGLSPRVRWKPRPDERIYVPAIELREAAG